MADNGTLQQIFRAGLVIVGLHLLLQNLNQRRDRQDLENAMANMKIPVNPLSLSNGDEMAELGNINLLESEIDEASDNLLMEDLVTAGMSEEESKGFASKSREELARLQMAEHAESDLTLEEVLARQFQGAASPVKGSNSCPSDHQRADFGSESATPFSRSIGIHGYSAGSQQHDKNQLGKYFNAEMYHPKFDAEKNNIGSQFKVTPGLAPYRGNRKNNVQIDSRVYKGGEHRVGPHGKLGGSNNCPNQPKGYAPYDTYGNQYASV